MNGVSPGLTWEFQANGDAIPAFRQPGLEFTTEPVDELRTTSPATSDRMQAVADDVLGLIHRSCGSHWSPSFDHGCRRFLVPAHHA